ncbi:Uncharacterized protein TCM_005110 [Theobroma cacao]|uniref:Transmembrane protein n=1 Tax=Theobroma cacao TaxID=3641 RepID=A0A061DTH9_THECC|nr:Uncharacterized protein TCM_005110 [Theobroma cacao]
MENKTILLHNTSRIFFFFFVFLVMGVLFCDGDAYGFKFWETAMASESQCLFSFQFGYDLQSRNTLSSLTRGKRGGKPPLHFLPSFVPCSFPIV